MNAEAVQKYFRELNRQEKFYTVRRIYKDKEVEMAKLDHNSDKIKRQYNYAEENIRALQNVRMSTTSSSADGGFSGNNTSYYVS